MIIARPFRYKTGILQFGFSWAFYSPTPLRHLRESSSAFSFSTFFRRVFYAVQFPLHYCPPFLPGR